MPQIEEFSDSRLAMGLNEIVEDNIKQAIRHMQDVTTEEKPSVLTIKITLLPNERRNFFAAAISCTTTLSPRKTFKSEIFGGVDQDGKVYLSENNPRQGTLDLGPTGL
jgi:hypothetical protein